MDRIVVFGICISSFPSFQILFELIQKVMIRQLNSNETIIWSKLNWIYSIFGIQSILKNPKIFRIRYSVFGFWSNFTIRSNTREKHCPCYYSLKCIRKFLIPKLKQQFAKKKEMIVCWKLELETNLSLNPNSAGKNGNMEWKYGMEMETNILT